MARSSSCHASSGSRPGSISARWHGAHGYSYAISRIIYLSWRRRGGLLGKQIKFIRAAHRLGPRARIEFISTAETWCSTVLGLVESRSAISPLLRPSARRGRTSSWRLVSPCGFARVWGRGPRGRPRAPRSWSRRRAISTAEWRPRRSKIAERRPLGRFIAIEERERLFPGTAKPLPGVRRRAPVARDLQRHRARSAWRRLRTTPPRLRPEREFAIIPRERRCGVALEADARPRPHSPRDRLAAISTPRAQRPSERCTDIAGGQRQITRLVERRFRASGSPRRARSRPNTISAGMRFAADPRGRPGWRWRPRRLPPNHPDPAGRAPVRPADFAARCPRSCSAQ